jgi:hypothetical protein
MWSACGSSEKGGVSFFRLDYYGGGAGPLNSATERTKEAPVMRTATIATALVLALASPAAAYDTGNEFYTQCSDLRYQPYRLGFVMGVIAGFNIGVQLALGNPEAAQARKDELNICSPDNATAGQALDMVMQYLRDHPERRDWSATVLIVGTLHTYWPC